MSAQIVDRDVISKEWNLQPEDFIDLKALAGDPSDNIPGAPGIGPKTATELLIKFDTIVKLYEQIESKITPLSVISNESEKSHEASKQEISPPVSPSRDDKQIEQVAKELEIKPRILKILIEFKDQVFLSQRLATIRRDVPLDFNIKDCEWGDYDKEEVKGFFNEMQFNSLLRRFGGATGENPTKTKSENPKQNSKDEQLQLL
jgi:DNA polymerase-1